MLTLTIPAGRGFNEETSEIITLDEIVLELEHSLVSLAKWESSWEKPFLGRDQKTDVETLSYIRAMTITPNVPPETFLRLNDEHLELINNYISAKMTATWFTDSSPKTAKQEVITAEIIYYWMIELNIPFECQEWHLNRLLTLVKVLNNKRAKPQKMSKAEIARQQAEINARRRAEYNTRG